MLTISGITVRLGGRTIIDRASATVPTGARVGLIGRNGAGKSTLMKVLIGEIEPDEGSVDMPRRARLGYIAQEAPTGTATPFESVLAADTERAALLIEADTCTDPDRLADVHERLIAIDAYTAPARAARILIGLGFDEAMQASPLDSFSGGWKMRVALASLLFSQPDVLLLDEPSNHLDLEATLWLENFLRSYPGTLIVISHERDLLNNVVDNILHLQGGKVTLYPGGYDSFERQRAERAAQAAAAQAAQASQRAKLEDYVRRNSARASTAKQAQSRAKMLAKMQPVVAMLEDPSLTFDFPSPDELRPPLITLDMAAVGYAPGQPILKRLNLRIDPDDRIALLGRNGNGKTTLARLLAGQLPAMEGGMTTSGKLAIGYFTQYQVEELAGSDTPLLHMTRAMEGKTQAAVRAQLGRFGFSGNKATTEVSRLSGGERARLALALVTRDAPHLLILDEPTNHLDVDAREALVQALNAYQGAVILISHDRHMVELTADRLVLVDDGAAVPYDGSMEDYIDFVLGRNQPKADAAAKPAASPKTEAEKAATQAAWQARRELGKQIAKAEKDMAKLQARIADIDAALADPAKATGQLKGMNLGAMGKLREDLEAELARVEAQWLAWSEQVDG
ncbi:MULTISPECIES: ABC-F family ATP-binding cassette domain-containing protein [Novosphingobium]|uniref:ABC-F family ATP-binding cassette domain-containing protein n=1 Tax=Novosphingobium TaxID=165696 RepID=UPI0003B68DE7|nr:MULTISPECIES: ABC-F family ATP-binding cassette domain-containing protein [Novosphingobium]MBB3356871.1 ATP-binding cassette subfamily F protein 3 [Novosphingobium sp. BK256]MBB3373272.1 ATP-binding cassette subfamily F protein 3 [Novosphingobium sp. BK280]MBB3377641.1 ATP-binding cassette subfamily F protein 3 [Novosphingobium sp. BK258]MBB3418948.1 ATP-binding cassette subfamily F protein 3 [Novosphingobium sp. BK267]MBB3450217.1 ATP-binding cassette subfamily F protein 3 [Novosphingobium